MVAAQHRLQAAGGPTGLWKDFLASICGRLSHHTLNTWLRPVSCSHFDGATATLVVPDAFFRDWLADHYLDVIKEGLAQCVGTAVEVVWRVAGEGQGSPDPPRSPTRRRGGEGRPAGTRRAALVAPPSSTPPPPGDAAVGAGGRYRFNSFVCGPSNQFALAACKAAAENPGSSYNPLFIYGGVGLGKTHLLNAIGHQIRAVRPQANVLFTTSEQFTNEVIDAVLKSRLEDFRARYRRRCDVILIDDIQLIAGKERTQNEFFHIFNTLYDLQRQIVVTSDKLPHQIPDIAERLRNRFQWGLIADVQPPEVETRVAILRQKAASEGIALGDEIAFYLARRIRSNVRELEGALVRILAHASLNDAPITVDYARGVISEVLAPQRAKTSVERVQRTVAAHFKVRLGDLRGKSRLRALVGPRQIAMYLSRKHTTISFPEMGARFGDRDHSTVMAACQRIEQRIADDAPTRGHVLAIERLLDVAAPG